jgi:hypothetical protein
MECFAHPSAVAVGICKCCGKGACRSCAIPVTRGLACSEGCKETSESLSQLQAAQIRNIRITAAQRLVIPSFSVALIAFGIVMVVQGDSGIFPWFYLVLGAVIGLAPALARLKQSGTQR